jgi:hypothetical protein
MDWFITFKALNDSGLFAITFTTLYNVYNVV